jgi:hypothetical protein
MQTLVRYGLFVVVAVQVFFAVALFFQWPAVAALWPFAGTTPLTFIFISSIFAAAAASTYWAAAARSYAALAGIGLDYITILLPVAIFTLGLGLRGSNGQMAGYGIVCLLGVAFGAALLAWSLRQPLDRSRPVPRLVQWSFAVFIAALLVVSTRLLLKHPNVIPWTITPELSVVIGWMFLGAATYFAYGLLRPSWANAAGQLAGFLAYDVVLIGPFFQRLPTVAPEHRVGLIIYTAIVSYSGLLAIYYLFIHPATRVWSRPRLSGASAAEKGPATTQGGSASRR